MKLLIDTDVVLDVMLKREGFKDSDAVMALSKHDDIQVYVAASSITEIYHIVRANCGDRIQAFDMLDHLVHQVIIADVSHKEISRAMNLAWDDFEDALQCSIAISVGADYVVTKNVDRYISPRVRVMSPEQLLELFD